MLRVEAFARALERAAEREKARREPAEERRFLAELLDECVAWLQSFVPPLVRPFNPRQRLLSRTEVVVMRLGLRDEASAKARAMVRRYYAQVFEAADGSKSLAARVLGIHRRTIKRSLE